MVAHEKEQRAGVHLASGRLRFAPDGRAERQNPPVHQGLIVPPLREPFAYALVVSVVTTQECAVDAPGGARRYIYGSSLGLVAGEVLQSIAVESIHAFYQAPEAAAENQSCPCKGIGSKTPGVAICGAE